ncbi:Stanniocalcin-2 [Madurella fahalii]|uniref:Stanniocalcin-2 n=1 Tax=Madurella fahalii TaxID=1157608 RepID=A0ABQ0FYS2_9PEZI
MRCSLPLGFSPWQKHAAASRLEVSESAFNPALQPFSVKLVCSKAPLDAENYTAFANWNVIPGITSTGTEIQIPQLQAGSVLLSVYAFTADGVPVSASFDLLFGAINMPVLVLDPAGQPAPGVLVQADSTMFPGISQSGLTGPDGRIEIRNLPDTTIALLARTDADEIAISGVAATNAQVTLKLTSPSTPSGTNAEGWSVNPAKRSSDMLGSKRQAGLPFLVVSTNNAYDVQTAQRTIAVEPGTTKAFVRYKFVTNEYPTYFGTQYNDYYSVTLRSDTGAFATVSNSMNNLGHGAFDALGSTAWMTLELSLPAGTTSVTCVVGVSNVGDAAVQSEVVVEELGVNGCARCGEDCGECPESAHCQDECRNPSHSCSFYRQCAEPVAGCGPSGYPLYYGERNCNKFVRNSPSFSAGGRLWIQSTMNCLQRALVPLLQGCPTCPTLHQVAFDSHPDCYVGSGICSLGCWDVAMVLSTIGTDLFTSLGQGAQTGLQCLADPEDTFGVGCAGDVVDLLAAATPQSRAMALAIAVLRGVLKDILSD